MKAVLAIGAHYDDCVFGIPGILIQAVRKHYRVVVLSVIGDYANWTPVKGREAEFVRQVTEVGREYGAEMRFLPYASHKFDVTTETKQAVAEVVTEVQPEVSFVMWPHDRHHDHEVAGTLGTIAVQHGDRVLDGREYRPARTVYAFDNGPRHTVGFEPNTYVDVTAEWPKAVEWLGRTMAATAGKPFDPTAPPGGVERAKEALEAYRGFAWGSGTPRPSGPSRPPPATSCSPAAPGWRAGGQRGSPGSSRGSDR
jgi:LmbE family N-acetylglucosaminyl deacetylase